VEQILSARHELVQHSQVEVIVGVEVVTGVTANLEVDAEAGDGLIGDQAGAAETFGVVVELAAVGQGLVAAASRIDADWVEVNPAVGAIAKDETDGPLVTVHDETTLGERGDRDVNVVSIDDEVEVVVHARFAFSKGIDAPAAVYPGADARTPEHDKDVQNVSREHHHAKVLLPDA
jgi:hypothetical protein